MQIQVSAGDCRAAIAAHIAAAKAKAAEDRQTITDASFKALKEGAVHNGLDVNAAREKEMHEMVGRDVTHMMEKHPSVEILNILLNYALMLDYHEAALITIDDQDFHLLKNYLPK